jgi:amino acid transporter
MEYKPENFSRSIGLFGLTMVGVGSIIGSGWLFGAYLAAKLAGPAAIFSWIIGGAVVMLIALTISELASSFPKAGGMVRYLEYSHGSLAGFTIAWANWIGIVAAIPSEAEASIQYMSSWQWAWTQGLYNAGTHSLTTTGMIGAGILLILYFLLNYWSINLFVRFISAITVFKVFVPILTAVMILYSGFHPSNFTAVGNTLVPYGWESIVTAVITCGIIFSFNGFQSAANFAAEAKKPHIYLPLSIVLAIVITLILYLLLQVAFLGAVSPAQLAAEHGWQGIDFNSPLVELALLFQLNFVALLIYTNSFISPSGTGVIYLASSSRMLYGMERNGYMPAFMGVLDPRYKVPRNAVIVNILLCFGIMYCFPGWAHIVPLISIVNIVAFMPGPIVIGGLRRIGSDIPRLFKLPLVHLIAPITFALITLLLYWATWPLTGETILLLAMSLVVYFFYQHKQGWPNFAKQFRGARWLIVYFMGVSVLSYCGGGNFGGKGLMSSLVTHVTVILFSFVIYYWAVQSAWRTPALEECLKESK